MLTLRRAQGLAVVAFLAAMIPARAAEVDKTMPEDLVMVEGLEFLPEAEAPRMRLEADRIRTFLADTERWLRGVIRLGQK